MEQQPRNHHDLLSDWQKLGLPTPETTEEAYRRGYRDGWENGSGRLMELLQHQGMSTIAAYRYCFDFYEQQLLEWVRRAESESASKEHPPVLSNPSAEDM